MDIMISNILNSYVNKWVALTKDKKKVVVWAPDLKKLDIKVKEAKLRDVIYHYVLPYDKAFSP